jgi:hypothetical protein
VNTTTVFRATPVASSASSRRPTFVSMFETIP